MDNSKNSNSRRGGIGFVGLLQIVFIVLKLVGVIDWKWIWVLSPIWIDTLLYIAIIIIIKIITGDKRL